MEPKKHAYLTKQTVLNAIRVAKALDLHVTYKNHIVLSVTTGLDTTLTIFNETAKEYSAYMLNHKDFRLDDGMLLMDWYKQYLRVQQEIIKELEL
jgi:hypothetical protein